MKIGIDLLWVRPGICGGTESFIRNLLDGFFAYDNQNEYVLFVTRDNEGSFRYYGKKTYAFLHVCHVDSANPVKRIFWENLFLDNIAKKEKVDVMFIPVYSKPLSLGSKIPYVCVIHDLQALHYPQYFSSAKRLFLKYMWWYTCKTSKRIVTDSDFCKEDIAGHYPKAAEKLTRIHVPVVTVHSDVKAETIEKKYGVKQGEYFYCVSSMLPHKNLNTILQAIKLRRDRGERNILVLSGVGGEAAEFEAAVAALGIGDLVVNTGFVTDDERDCLYENCRLFLFPSVFEGFGMPPIEAMRRGKPVVMTKESCLEEVTDGKAVYVEKPYDAEEWSQKIDFAMKIKPEIQAFEQYELKNVMEQYLKILTDARA